MTEKNKKKMQATPIRYTYLSNQNRQSAQVYIGDCSFDLLFRSIQKHFDFDFEVTV